ncbi:MAG: TrmH family RNA methyltransferase [Prevotella sp.]|nr:TrmH family RNA methyltransferase [Prevotella sp.]
MRKLRTIEMHRLSVEQFKEAAKLPLIVVLDDVRSLHNVGSVFRTCDAFRVQAVYLCGITATPPNAEIHKTALGGEDSVDWRYFETAEAAVEDLHRRGYWVYSVEQVEGSVKLENLNLTAGSSPAEQDDDGDEVMRDEGLAVRSSPAERDDDGDEVMRDEGLAVGSSPAERGQGYAVIFGNEVKGVKQRVVDMSDACLEIPQFGTKHSLNVSVTAGIVIWEFARQLLLRR